MRTCRHVLGCMIARVDTLGCMLGVPRAWDARCRQGRKLRDTNAQNHVRPRLNIKALITIYHVNAHCYSSGASYDPSAPLG